MRPITAPAKALLTAASSFKGMKPAKALRGAMRRGLGLLRSLSRVSCMGGCSGMVLEEGVQSHFL
jgi:hypothetical protein